MITWSEFNSYALDRKIKALYESGTFITAIRYYRYKVNLYLLDNHYVEVFYHHKKDLIEKILLLNPRHTRMKFYYDQIKLPRDLVQ